jgi:hypothetical protein
MLDYRQAAYALVALTTIIYVRRWFWADRQQVIHYSVTCFRGSSWHIPA